MAHSTARRRTAYPFYKLAYWCPRSLCWKELRPGYPTRPAAESAARLPGRYRVTEVRGPGDFAYVGEVIR